MNRVILIGNLTRDPESGATQKRSIILQIFYSGQSQIQQRKRDY